PQASVRYDRRSGRPPSVADRSAIGVPPFSQVRPAERSSTLVADRSADRSSPGIRQVRPTERSSILAVINLRKSSSEAMRKQQLPFEPLQLLERIGIGVRIGRMLAPRRCLTSVD